LRKYVAAATGPNAQAGMTSHLDSRTMYNVTKTRVESGTHADCMRGGIGALPDR
jgi:hypothetical protein